MSNAKYILTAIVLFASASLYFTAPAESKTITETKTPEQQAAAPKYALLVGVNNYIKGSGIRALRGTHYDVEMMRDLLTDVYKFKDESPSQKSIRTLLDSAATQAEITKAFREQLIKKAKEFKDTAKVDASKGATIVFYYSGHGSKLEDQNNDEIDGIDETIMPYDTNTDRTKNRDIRDDQFDDWLRELGEYTTNVTLIFDSCHSGTLSRGGSAKSVDRVLDLPATSKSPSGAPNDGMGRNESYVAISGSLPTQESQEDDFPVLNKDGTQAGIIRRNGALTYGFVNMLRRNPDVTYRELMKVVQDNVVAMNKNQTPQAEGDIDRAVFSGPETRGAVPIFIESSSLIKKTIDTTEVEVNQIKMKVGAIVGAGSGATIAVYERKPGEARKQIGSGVVTEATDFASTAEVVRIDKATEKVPDNVSIFIISPSFRQKEKQVVALDFAGVTSSSEVATDIENRLKTSTLIETVKKNDILKNISKDSATRASTNADLWNVAVVRGSYGEFKKNNKQPDLKAVGKNNQAAPTTGVDPCAQKRFMGAEPKEPTDIETGFFLSDRVGNPLYNLWYAENDANAGKCLSEALEKYAKLENLRNLQNTSSALNAGFSVKLIRLKSFEIVRSPAFQCKIEAVSDAEQLEDQNKTPQMRPDDKFYLEISNNTGTDLFVYLYTLTTSGRIGLLHPVKGAAQGEKFLTGKSASTLQLLEPVLRIPNKAKQSNCAVFYVEPPEASPPGLETLKVIATTVEFPGEIFEQAGIAKGIRGASLSQLILQAATGTRTGTMRYDVDEFVTKEINYQIVH